MMLPSVAEMWWCIDYYILNINSEWTCYWDHITIKPSRYNTQVNTHGCTKFTDFFFFIIDAFGEHLSELG